MKKIIFLLICTLTFANSNYVSRLIGDDEGNIYISKNQNQIHSLASVTKLMTSLLIVEKIEKNELKLNDKLIMTREITSLGGSRIYMKVGEKLSILDLLKSTQIHSANNAAYALSKTMGTEKFVAKMNEKAKELNMNKTSYFTPNGLPSYMTGKGMDRSSASDVYRLSLEAIKHPLLLNLAGRKKDMIRKRDVIYNRNKLLGIENIDGLKTGHHDEAGYNIAVTTKINGKRFIVVVMGSPNEKTRDKVVLDTIKEFKEKYTERILIGDEEIHLGDLVFISDKIETKLLKKTDKVKKKINFYQDENEKIEANLKVFINDKLYLEKNFEKYKGEK